MNLLISIGMYAVALAGLIMFGRFLKECDESARTSTKGK